MDIAYFWWLLLINVANTETVRHDNAINVAGVQTRASKDSNQKVATNFREKNVKDVVSKLRDEDKSNTPDSAADKSSANPTKSVSDEESGHAFLKAIKKNKYICPKGVEVFAGELKTDYYSCEEEGESAILKKCQNGATYNPSMETCHFPSETKRSAKSEFLYEPVFGRQVYLGDLFDATSNRILTGVSLWKDETIKKEKRSSLNTNSKVVFSAAKTSFERISELKVSAEIKLSFLCGLIEVDGSARYLKESIERLDYVSMSMEYAAKSFYETLPIFTPIDYTDLCNDVKEIKATHVVSTVQYGLNANFEFLKQVKSGESKEDIQGKLKMAVHYIPVFKVKEGDAYVEVEGEMKEVVKGINVKLFGDFILDKQPTSYAEAIHVFQDLPKYLGEKDKYEKSSKMNMILTPISLYCKESDMILNSISNSLINEVTKMLGSLEETKIVANTLRVSEPANKFLPIAHNLDKYLNAIQVFTIKLQSQLQEILPKIRSGSRNAGEGNLTSLLTQYRQSPFHQSTSKLYLDIRMREVNVIQLILDKLRRGSKNIVVTNYVNANDAKIHLNQEHVLVMDVSCLPLLNVTESFLNLKRVEPNVAWFDNKTILGSIGKQFDKFIEFATINNDKTHGYIVELAKSGNTPIAVYARKSGEELTKHFIFPQKPVMVMEHNISTTHESLSFTIRKPKNPFIKGLKIQYWKLAENDTTLATRYIPFNINNQFEDVIIDGLIANRMYAFLLIHVTAMGDSPSSEESSAIRSRPSSKPTNIQVQSLSPTNVTIVWDEPNYIGEGVMLNKYKIQVTGDGYLTARVVEAVRSATFPRLTPATKYTVHIEAVDENSRARSLKATYKFITLPETPTPPNVVDVGFHDVNLTWSTPIVAVGGTIQGYRVVYCKVNNLGDQPLGSDIGLSSQTTRVTLTDLTQGTTYNVKVKVLTDLGDSLYSRATILKTKYRKTDLDRLRSSIHEEISHSVAEQESKVRIIINQLSSNLTADIQRGRGETAAVRIIINELSSNLTADIQRGMEETAAVQSTVNELTDNVTQIYGIINTVIRFPRPNLGVDGGGRYIWGYVEIYHNRQWGSICDDNFDHNNNGANVLCRTGGYSSGTYDHGAYKQNNHGISKASKIWLSNVRCTGSENIIDSCPKSPWGIHYCSRSEDVGVKCYF